MTAEQLRRAQRIFQQALERPSSERDAFLAGVCDDDGSLRETVDTLLAADARSDGFLGEPLARPTVSALGPLEPGAWPSLRQVGDYEILGKIGQGGTSSVFLARRTNGEAQREVAIKVVRSDFHQPGAERRLRNEEQILSALDHPYVARLIEAGTTPANQPFFVMEYVDGVAITEYCDAGRLSLRRRLELFRRVCEAVRYAHQNLIVHRDLKPSNILVDGEGRPKLLDFGIAKLLAPVGNADATQSAARVLTPSYAAPEHWSGGRITTATDVYSLGVLLYELLVGRRPYEWMGLAPQEIVQRWERQEPALPSAVVVSAAAKRQSVAQDEGYDPSEEARRRDTTVAGLARALGGDLDNIALRALRFEPERRYGSVTALSEDIRRHIEGLPVTARPATRRYRFAKFARRHTWALINAGIILLLVLGLAVSTVVQSGRILQERDTAEAERANAELEKLRAERERGRAEAVTRFLIESFELADPFSGQGRSITAKEIIDRGATWIDEDLGGEPDVQGTVKHALGRIYHRLGLYDEAEALLSEALQIRRDLSGSDHVDTANALADLASVRASQGDIEGAEALAREALETRQRILGETSPQAGSSLRILAELASDRGDYGAAVDLVQRALEIHQTSAAGDSAEVALDLNALMEIQMANGDALAAERTGRRALAMSRAVFPPGSPAIAEDLGNLGSALWALGRFEESEAMHIEALEMRRRRLGSDHPAIASNLNNLASLKLELGDFDGAERLLSEALELFRKRLDERHPGVARTIANLGVAFMASGRFEDAEPQFRRALELHRELFGDDHPMVAEDLHHLGTNHFLAGDWETAEPLLRQALRVRQATFGDRALRTAESVMMMARVTQRLGRLDEAENFYRQALLSFVDTRGEEHWLVALARLRLVELEASRGRLEGAEARARAAIHQLGESLSPDHWRTAEGRSVLGGVLRALGRNAEAEQELLAAYGRLRASKGEEALPTQDAARRLVGLYEDWGRPQEAERFREQAAVGHRVSG